MTPLELTPPTAITADHQTANFDSSEASLDEWLKKRALKNRASGVSRCFVLCSRRTVVGYYSLSAGAISRENAPKMMQHNTPDLLPVLLLGRLAVHRQYHNQGLGSALLRDAMLRALRVANNTGVFVILVHVLHNQAKQFYLSRGFVPPPLTADDLNDDACHGTANLG